MAFVVVEQKEPHAGRMAFAAIEQPATFADRCALARRVRDELEVPLPIFVDGMDDASRALFSDLPSPAFVIDRQGRVAEKLPWADPEELRKSVAAIAAKEAIPGAKTGPWTLDERDAFARRLVALGKPDEAIAWLDARSEPAPSVPPTTIAVARAAITRVLAMRGAERSARTEAMTAARKAIAAAWPKDPARLTAARIELAEAMHDVEPTSVWQAALAGLDPRAPSVTRQWLAQKSGLAGSRR